jgi:hypothetical protein
MHSGRTRALVLLLILSGTPAWGQETVSFNAQTFRPALGPGSLFTVEGTLMPRRLWPMGGVVFAYAHRPLRAVVADSGETWANTVPGLVTAHLMPGAGLTRWLAVAADLPVVLYQRFDDRTPITDLPTRPTVAGVGDLRLLLRARLRDNEVRGLGLAALAQLSFPTGSVASLRGDGTVGIEGRLAADYRFARGFLLALNLAFYVRTYNRDLTFGTTRVGDQLRYGIGGYAPIGKGFGALGELAGAVGLSRADGGDVYAPLEGLLGARYAHRSGLQATLGGGGALLSPVGTPSFRLLFGVAYVPAGAPPKRPAPEPPPAPRPGRAGQAAPAPVSDDEDGDGVSDSLDRCPNRAGPRDNEGCPGSGERPAPPRTSPVTPPPPAAKPPPPVTPPPSPVAPPASPPEPEPSPGPAPAESLDADGDGITDSADRCPAKAGPMEHQGCPLLDVSDTLIRLGQPVRFAAGSATPEGDLAPLCKALARLLELDPAIKKLRITVPGGEQKGAKRLAGQRAKALSRLLLDQGLGKKQLQVRPVKGPGDAISEIELLRGKKKRNRDR